MDTPYWLLIAVLRSTVPLEPALAMRLYHSAIELERSGTGSEQLSGDLAMGQLRRLGKHIALGSITGPGFEAELDTPRGAGVVRFVVTRQGLEQAGVFGEDELPTAAPRAPRYLN
jgi:hypothetical protein